MTKSALLPLYLIAEVHCFQCISIHLPGSCISTVNKVFIESFVIDSYVSNLTCCVHVNYSTLVVDVLRNGYNQRTAYFGMFSPMHILVGIMVLIVNIMMWGRSPDKDSMFLAEGEMSNRFCWVI